MLIRLMRGKSRFDKTLTIEYVLVVCWLTHDPIIANQHQHCKIITIPKASPNAIQLYKNPPVSSNPPMDRADFLDFPEVEDFLRLRPALSDVLIPEL
jgi:hypothetical protein